MNEYNFAGLTQKLNGLICTFLSFLYEPELVKKIAKTLLEQFYASKVDLWLREDLINTEIFYQNQGIAKETEKFRLILSFDKEKSNDDSYFTAFSEEDIQKIIREKKCKIISSSNEKIIFENNKILNERGVKNIGVFPLYDNSLAVGVYILYFKEEIDSESEMLLKIVNGLISQIIVKHITYIQIIQMKEFYQNILESTCDGIVTSDTDKKFRFWNKGAEHILGWKREEVLGKRLPVVPEEYMEELKVVLNKVYQGKHVTNYTTFRMSRNGSLVPVNASVSPLQNTEGEIIGAVATLRSWQPEKE